jgi:exopolysaccharide biosynthesis predicted pyruvyltransferase EpsI
VKSNPASALIGNLQNLIHDCLSEYISDAPLAILDFPDIQNVGDSAIWVGEIAYLRNRHRKRPVYVSRLHDFSSTAAEAAVGPHGPIFIHGGGNFGDIWPRHQEFRERILDLWPDRAVIQLPQSLHYSSEARADETARIIGRHKNFTLLCRDEESKAFAEKRFDCVVKLCPDMAFSIGSIPPPRNASIPVLAILREDRERVTRSAAIGCDISIEDWLTESASEVRKAKAAGMMKAILAVDWKATRLSKFDAAANNRLERGVRQLARARAIVTDRLHVHIICLLMGKPHAVLDNSYGKIARFMDAFSGDNTLSYRATSISDAVEWAKARSEAL